MCRVAPPLLGLLLAAGAAAAPPAASAEASANGSAAPSATRPAAHRYLAEVKPLLAAKCYACHGALKQEGGLRLDASTLIARGGDSGPAVVPGESDASLLVARVGADDAQRMPPAEEGARLTPEQADLLRTWIDEGALAPEEPIPPAATEHWAYRPPQLPEGLASTEAAGSNPIDVLLARRHAALRVAPAAAAPPGTLLRRVYLDLTGLPPTRWQLLDFLHDPSPAAYARHVDALLASPRYGERWARHWMDVWRYSDWSGFGEEVRYSQRHIWRWRDYIVDSLNADRGYDQMVVEMLAGDELAPSDPQVLRATGFLARNWYRYDRHAWLDDVVDHTCRAFLGVTMKCARCHDHKYDPIGQREYYRLRAVFEPYDVRAEALPDSLEADQPQELSCVHDAQPAAETWLFERGNPNAADRSAPVPPGVPRILGGDFAPRPVSLPLAAYYPALRPQAVQFERRRLRKTLAEARSGQSELSAEAATGSAGQAAQAEIDAAEARLAAFDARVAAERARLHLELPLTLEQHALLLTHRFAVARLHEWRTKDLDAEAAVCRAEHALASLTVPPDADQAAAAEARREAEQKVQEAKQQRDAVAGSPGDPQQRPYEPLGEISPAISSGRRLAFARWIVGPDHPLAARVAANHIWLRHFGQPLAPSVDDFGLRSPRPELAELLDFLAVDLVRHGWSMKHLHRRIVLSEAYRRASGMPAEAAAGGAVGGGAAGGNDPDNKTFWRMPARRLEAEPIRDAVLFVSGQLELTMGGPDLPHDSADAVRRRSIYFEHAYEEQPALLALFDGADPRECYRREESILPQQALALLNSEFTTQAARKLAAALAAELAGSVGDPASSAVFDHAFVRESFLALLAREPTDAETAACLEFLGAAADDAAPPTGATTAETAETAASRLATQADRARENLVLALMNHHDFLSLR